MMKKKGFTLVELLVVATIISLLAVLGVNSYSALTKQSRDAKRKTDLENMRSALELYRSDNDYYVGVLTTLAPSSYLKITPQDPKPGRSYVYCPAGTSPQYTNYYLCASLEGRTTTTACCGSCGSGVSCNYKLTPLGEE